MFSLFITTLPIFSVLNCCISADEKDRTQSLQPLQLNDRMQSSLKVQVSERYSLKGPTVIF